MTTAAGHDRRVDATDVLSGLNPVRYVSPPIDGPFYAPTAAGAAGARSERPAPSVRDAVHRTLAGDGGEMALDRLARTVAAPDALVLDACQFGAKIKPLCYLH